MTRRCIVGTIALLVAVPYIDLCGEPVGMSAESLRLLIE
jgi:hypothetical protein